MAYYPHYNTYTIQLRRTIKSPIERVCNALLDRDIRNQWFQNEISIDAQQNGMFKTSQGFYGVFKDVVPGSLWRIEWYSNENSLHSSLVVVEFERVGKWTTTIHVRHSRIRDQQQYNHMYSYWLWLLESLRTFLEYRDPIDYSTFMSRHSMSEQLKHQKCGTV